MNNFDLQWFINKTNAKPITIEFLNSDGDLLSIVNTVINDVEFKEESYWNILSINDGSVKLYFEDFEICELENAKNALLLYYKGEVLVNIYLPEGDSWELNGSETIGFIQY